GDNGQGGDRLIAEGNDGRVSATVVGEKADFEIGGNGGIDVVRAPPVNAEHRVRRSDGEVVGALLAALNVAAEGPAVGDGGLAEDRRRLRVGRDSQTSACDA